MKDPKKEIISEFLREIARRGGKASARALTAKQRSERARRGGLARAAQLKKGARS